MKKYLNVYRALIRLNFSALVVYRANVINNILGSTVWGVFSIVSIVLMTARTTSIFGWTRYEILLLSGVYGLFMGIYHTLFSRNFERLTSLIRLGMMDAILTKPVDSQFLVSTSIINYSSIIRIFLGAAFMWYMISIAHIVVTLPIVGLFCIGIIIGLLLLYSLWFIVATLIIWYPDLSNLIEFLYSVSNIGRFPREMYAHMNQFLFLFILPLTFMIIAPTKILLTKLTVFDALGLLMFAAIFFVGSRFFWKFALRYYTSASS
ncbi:MAG: ABC-2 family transporter protein [Candidatus Gottesmanbacteria bacterium]|nr:ABC-2 family transporter protein [Candidatus Gottesmanbacteria bacterium]